MSFVGTPDPLLDPFYRLLTASRRLTGPVSAAPPPSGVFGPNSTTVAPGAGRAAGTGTGGRTTRPTVNPDGTPVTPDGRGGGSSRPTVGPEARGPNKNVPGGPVVQPSPPLTVPGNGVVGADLPPDTFNSTLPVLPPNYQPAPTGTVNGGLRPPGDDVFNEFLRLWAPLIGGYGL